MSSYFTSVKAESLVNKHVVASVWISVALAVIQIALVVVLHAGAQALQQQSQELQNLQFLEEQNHQNRERLKESLMAFGQNVNHGVNPVCCDPCPRGDHGAQAKSPNQKTPIPKPAQGSQRMR